MDNKYIPINCDFYDRLEAWAINKEKVFINYTREEVETNAEGLIKDLYLKQKVEYLLLSDGSEIRLDCINSVNGIPVPYNC